MHSVRSKHTTPYVALPHRDEPRLEPDEEALVRDALRLIYRRYFSWESEPMSSRGITAAYLQIRFAPLPYEVFACLFLDSQHRLIATEELFRGTVNGPTVHSREVVKAVLRHNAAAVILLDNHPSGATEPSHSDEALTRRLTEALDLVDVRVLDQFIVGDGFTSFAESGLV